MQRQTSCAQKHHILLQAAASGSLLEVGDHAAQLVSSRHPSNNHHSQPQQRHCKVLHAWGLATSPHLAVQREGRLVAFTPHLQGITKLKKAMSNTVASCCWLAGSPGRPVSDTQVTASTLAEIQAYTRGLVSAGGTSGAEALCLVETAGGVASPAPSGQLMVRDCPSRALSAELLLVAHSPASFS
jgi:dethiobiotin synthetase